MVFSHEHRQYSRRRRRSLYSSPLHPHSCRIVDALPPSFKTKRPRYHVTHCTRASSRRRRRQYQLQVCVHIFEIYFVINVLSIRGSSFFFPFCVFQISKKSHAHTTYEQYTHRVRGAPCGCSRQPLPSRTHRNANAVNIDIRRGRHADHATATSRKFAARRSTHITRQLKSAADPIDDANYGRLL